MYRVSILALALTVIGAPLELDDTIAPQPIFVRSERLQIRGTVPKGYKIQYVGHSFHQFLPTPMATLAKEAGIKGHVTLGFDMLPASYPCQHWNKNPNKVKERLNAGQVDLLTLASREIAPDPCIPKFAKLAYDHNKNIRVMVQETWLPVSADPGERCTTPKVGPGGSNPGINTCKNRDAATYQSLETTRSKWEAPFRKLLRDQLAGINKQLGKNVTSLVPVWDGVLALRQNVVQGKVPGVSKQSSLFRDGLGHATKPLQDLVTYMWFSSMYGINPAGYKSLTSSASQAKVLQRIAWDTVKKEPLNGVM